jgi:ribosomal protein L30/L7E
VCSTHGKMKKERMCALGRQILTEFSYKRLKGRDRSKNNIKVSLKEFGLERLNWTYVARDRKQWRALVSSAMNHRISLKAGIFLTS